MGKRDLSEFKKKKVDEITFEDLEALTDGELVTQLDFMYDTKCVLRKVGFDLLMVQIQNILESRGYEVSYHSYRDSDGDKENVVICVKREEIEWY